MKEFKVAMSNHKVKLVGGPADGTEIEVHFLVDSITVPRFETNHRYDLQSLFGYPIWQNGHAIYEYKP